MALDNGGHLVYIRSFSNTVMLLNLIMFEQTFHFPVAQIARLGALLLEEKLQFLSGTLALDLVAIFSLYTGCFTGCASFVYQMLIMVFLLNKCNIF